MTTAPAARVRQGGDERGESSDGILWAQDEGSLDEEVDDQPEDGAAPDELAEAHGSLEIGAPAVDVSTSPARRLQRRIAP